MSIGQAGGLVQVAADPGCVSTGKREAGIGARGTVTIKVIIFLSAAFSPWYQSVCILGFVSELFFCFGIGFAPPRIFVCANRYSISRDC